VSGSTVIILKLDTKLKLNGTYQTMGYKKLNKTAFFAKLVEFLAHTILVASFCESSITWLAKHCLLYIKELLRGQIS